MVKIILFLLTIASTYFVGGAAYSVSIMAILLAHEMGHYFMSKKYGLPATLPYFLPFPFSPFGTFGAVIRMKGIITDKKALFDIGIAGPLAGFVVAVPCIVVGIKLSSVQAISTSVPLMQLGDPLLFKIFQRLIIGDIPAGYDMVLHPFGYAGWVGLFVTALNLLPVGQLDGGHVVYAIFGKNGKWVSVAAIVSLGVLAIFHNPSWLALVIILLIFGMRHPEPLDTETRLNRPRLVLAVLVLAVFVLSFTPAPFPSLNWDIPAAPPESNEIYI